MTHHLLLPEEINPSSLQLDVWEDPSSKDEPTPTLSDLWDDPSLEGPFLSPCGGRYLNIRFIGEEGGSHVHLMQALEVGPSQSQLRKGHRMKMAIGPNGGIERVH